MKRDEMIAAIERLPDALPEQLYYIESLDTDDHPEHSFCFCCEHADMVAHVESIMTGADMHIAAAWAGDDNAERCHWYGCDKPLDGGGLTNYGIDSALGLTEEKPLECHVYPAELVLAARSMLDNDPRWVTWEHHARRLLRDQPNA
jgi:hypothetical protein